MTLTSSDFENMENLIRQVVRDETENLLTKDDINHLPTKDEFYTETSKIYKKLQDIDDSQDILSARVSKHSDEISELKDLASRT